MSTSNYPTEFDTDENLFLVHDGLRLRLAEDYMPGDTSIVVIGEEEQLLILDKMPPTGIITLTEQCSEIDDRAIAFSYSSVDFATRTIGGLEILEGFADTPKPKRITHATMNVMAEQHNCLKDALINIQNFAGVEGTEDEVPFGETLEGRINFLRRLVLQPKAWFSSNIRTGIAPLCIDFREMAFRLGTDGTAGPVTITWDFGDQTTSVISMASLISATDRVPNDAIDVIVRDDDQGLIRKCYMTPGIYTVKMTVENDFGSDTVIFDDYVTVRSKAPDEAVIRYVENTEFQEATPGVPPNGPYTTVPKIRSPINTFIEIEVPDGENPATPDRSWAGELLENGSPIDPIDTWSWNIADDLDHPNSPTTNASFSVGGIYDLILRVDTELGAYRITTYENSFDIIENENLWLFTFQGNTDNVRSYEYGLISETFKLTPANTFAVTRDDSFLNGKPEETKQKQEFNRNTGFARTGTAGSGRGETAILYWSSGRGESDPISVERIKFVEFSGFLGTYIVKDDVARAWNWFTTSISGSAYFFGGITTDSPLPNTSPVNTQLLTLDLLTFTSSAHNFVGSDYLNGAQELENNVSIYDNDGASTYGDFSVYRPAAKGITSYIAKNDGVGPFFRIRSFYRTEGTTGEPFTKLRKMNDIQGATKLEGQLTNLSQGVYFFNNTGSISSFNDTTTIWSIGGPGVNSIIYRSLQDTSVVGFDDPTNTLLATSDGDKRAYITYDYSDDIFIKFQELDTTFVTMGSRPAGEQWILGIF